MRGRVKITATAEVRAAVIAGIGLAIVPEGSFTPELKSGAVVLAMDEWRLWSISLLAVYPTGRQASTKATQFSAFAEHCLAS
jgi:DNA-binding transcriptional LysR family regulator